MAVHDSPFDSQIYGVKIGRLALQHADELLPALARARAEAFAVVFLRIAETETTIADALAQLGVSPLETLVTSVLSDAPVPRLAKPANISVEHHPVLADPADIAAVASLTAEAIAISHLHADTRLPRERTRHLYATWASNDVSGRAQRTILARAGREIVGYLTVLVAERAAVIDLVAVMPSGQGRGIGSALLTELVAWVRTEGLVARVGTQSDNAALALYQRFGFVPSERHSTYHLWLDSGS